MLSTSDSQHAYVYLLGTIFCTKGITTKGLQMMGKGGTGQKFTRKSHLQVRTYYSSVFVLKNVIVLKNGVSTLAHEVLASLFREPTGTNLPLRNRVKEITDIT